MSIKQVLLNNFRNYKSFCLNINSKLVLIYGDNGVGKTNILEAISLASPGRGLRNASNQDLLPLGTSSPWSVAITLIDEQSISIGSSIDNKRKIYRLNKSPLKSSTDILEVMRVVWLTPNMDYITSAAPAQKRKFIDRITFNFYPQHLKAINNYADAQQQRMKLLKAGVNDDIWLCKLETIMAEQAIKIATYRLNCLERINNEIENLNNSFSKPKLYFAGFIEENINTENILEVIKGKFKERRNIDIKAKSTTFGAHKTELIAINQHKNIHANNCSSGEQKAMVAAIIIAQANSICKTFEGSVVFLLDDIFSHFDRSKCLLLINELKKLKVQCFISATEDTYASDNFQNINLSHYL